MEEIVGLLFIFLRVLILEILFWTVFYWIGWSVCKAVTFGKYPYSLVSSNKNNRNTLLPVIGGTLCLAIFMSFIYWG
jgi:ABC-type phosphate transport system permease subunit